MPPLLPFTLFCVVGILLAELPAMIAYVVLGGVSLAAPVWFLRRWRGWGWSPAVTGVWAGYFLMQLTAPALPMHTAEASRQVRQLRRQEAAEVQLRTASLKDICSERLRSAGLNERSLSLARGILFGDKQAVSPELKDSMREAGMSHILAVSGLHVGILFAIFLTLLLPLRWVNEGLRLSLVLVILWGYVFFIGMPASAVRAGLMVTVATLSRFNHSSPWGWHNLVTAALLLLLWHPWWLWDLGFQLSFLATAGILVFRPAIAVRRQRVMPMAAERERLSGHHWHRRLQRWAKGLWQQLRSLFWLSASAQLATLPLVARVFGHVPLLGVLQGFVVVPLLPFYMGGLLLLLAFPALGTVFALPLNTFTAWIDSVADITAGGEQSLLGGRLEWSPSRLEMWLAYLAIAAGILFWRLRLQNKH